MAPNGGRWINELSARRSRSRTRRRWIAVSIALVVAQLGLAPTPAAAGNTVDGQFEGTGFLFAGTETRLTVSGRGGVPANANAVSLNITATQAAGNGYATLYPCGAPRPAASNLNFVAGADRANSVITTLGGGDVCIYTSQTMHVVVDVNGHFTSGSGYHSLTSARLYDSRAGSAPHGGSTTRVAVRGRGGVPADASAAVVNLTSTASTADGWAVVWPCDEPRPNASTVNYRRNADIANSMVVALGVSGDVCLFTERRTHLLLDVGGYFTNGSGYQPVTPARLLDSRPGAGTIDGASAGQGIISGGSTIGVQVAGRGGVPGSAASALLNLTVTGATGTGWAVLWSCDDPRPNASTINFGAGASIANSVITDLSSTGAVCIYSDRTAHLLIDVNGHLGSGPGFQALTPARLLDSRPTSPALVAAERSLELVNERRAQLGLAPVALDPEMSEYARNWSQTMASSGFRHGSSPWSENIGMWSAPSATPNRAAEVLHGAWVGSPPHHANMTKPSWTHVGIGFHLSSSGWYATHVFG